MFSLNSTIKDVLDYFGELGRLLFPIDLNFSEAETLQQISNSRHYIWYSELRPEKTVEIINYLAEEQQKRQIFYPIYSEKEQQLNPDLRNTGLFFFKGSPSAPFAVTNAGGGFVYVAGLQDSFPHALYLAKKGFNAFALIYRPNRAYQDLARAIAFIEDHAAELQVDPQHYSLWGGSAGARMAAELGNRATLIKLTGRTDIPQADAVITQYTGYGRVSRYDAPTYICVGKMDGIANYEGMRLRSFYLSKLGIPTEFHAYDGLHHGFGLGLGTIAEGWIDDAINFWKTQIH